MHENIPHWQMAGFLFTAITGTLLHFLFDWMGENPIIGLFSAVNESIWEHMKLLFYPMAVFAVAEFFLLKPTPAGFWSIKFLGILAGLALIPVLYYCYTGILGISADWFNITIFFLAAALSHYLEARLFENESGCRPGSKGAIAGLIFISLLFSLLTFFPPKIPFFRDPVTGTYGYQISTRK